MNIIMLVGMVYMLGVILYQKRVIAGKVNALRCAKKMYIKMCNRVFIECGIHTTKNMINEVETEVAKEMGLTI